MLFQPTRIDERQRDTTRYAAAIWLGVTQLLLVGVIFYRLYILGQPDEQIRDFQAVLGISLFGYLGLQLFLGGVMPIPTWKGAGGPGDPGHRVHRHRAARALAHRTPDRAAWTVTVSP